LLRNNTERDEMRTHLNNLADFDGDQLNGLLLIDFVSYEMLEPLEPHLGIVDMHTPFKFSSDMALEAPILATLNEWLRHAPK